MIYYIADLYGATIQPAYSVINYFAEDDGATGIPPVVYCDVYFNNTYYKTIIATSPFSIAGITSFWQFDIGGLAQEYMNTLVPDYTFAGLTTGFDGSIPSGYGACICYCKFRSSSQDSFGVITPGGTPPVQATVDTPAVAGTGLQSNEFIIVNAAQQITDILGIGVDGLESMLSTFRPTGLPGYGVNTANKAYPLTYSASQKIYSNDYGLFPLVTGNTAFNTASGNVASIPARIYVNVYKSSPLTLLYSGFVNAGTLNSESIYLLPCGMKNIAAIFPGAIPFLATADFYTVYLLDASFSSTNPVIFSTPPFLIQPHDGTQAPVMPVITVAGTPKHTRIWYQNYLGHFDQMNFFERAESVKTTSMATETPLKLYNNPLNRSNTSMSRNNVRSNEFNEVTGLFTEDMLPMVKQLVASSKTYIEFVSPENTLMRPPVSLLLPIVLIDSQYTTLGFDDRYEYRVSIKYMMSNEFKTVRN